MEHGPCELVVKHEGVLGEIKSDIAYIKDKIDNGLKDAVEDIKNIVNKTREVQQDKLDNRKESWIATVFEGSVKKFLGIIFLFILLSAATNTGMWAYFKTYGFQERPGQQAAIHSISTNGTYHLHTLPDGKIIFHGNTPEKPAWVLDPITKQWNRCPQFRTDESIGAK